MKELKNEKENVFEVIGLIGLCVLFIIMVMIAEVVFFDNIGDCLYRKGVGDPNQDVCRYDCIRWDKKEGCIQEEEKEED